MRFWVIFSAAVDELDWSIMQQTATLSTPLATDANRSPWRAFWYLVGFSFRRQWRGRQMLGIALGIALISLFLVLSFTVSTGWDRLQWRIDRSQPYASEFFAGGMAHAAVDQSPYMDRIRQETRPVAVFSRWVVFLLYLGFLLPLFCLSFGTGAMGQERESRSLVWLMTRPLPRGAVYLAKFLGVLPWALFLTLGVFGVLCLAGGAAGRTAFLLYSPGIFAGSIAFVAIFHLFGALFPRPAIIGLLYAFFFETMLSELPIPGTLKRLSVNYYTRCLLYSAGEKENVPTETSSLFVPVTAETAWIVLIGGAIVITAVGMWVFGRSEYRDDA
jgi:ABC-2 type transport system permease protein